MDDVTVNLTITRDTAADSFVEKLSGLQVALPLTTSEADVGVVFDATGRDVLTVDSNGVRPDLEAYQIAMWIVLAVNTCGGFKAEIRTNG